MMEGLYAAAAAQMATAVDRTQRLDELLPPPAYVGGPPLLDAGIDPNALRLGPRLVILAPVNDVQPIAWRYDPEAVAIGCVAGWISDED